MRSNANKLKRKNYTFIDCTLFVFSSSLDFDFYARFVSFLKEFKKLRKVADLGCADMYLYYFNPG